MVSFCAAVSSLCANAGGMIRASVAKMRCTIALLLRIARHDGNHARPCAA